MSGSARQGEKKGEKLEAMTKKHMDQFGKPAIDAHSRRMAKDRKGFQGVIDWVSARNSPRPCAVVSFAFKAWTSRVHFIGTKKVVYYSLAVRLTVYNILVIL